MTTHALATERASSLKSLLALLSTLLLLASPVGLFGCGPETVPWSPPTQQDPDDEEPTDEEEEEEEEEEDPPVEGEVGEACTPGPKTAKAVLTAAWPLTSETSALTEDDTVEVDGFTHWATFQSNGEGSFHYIDLNQGLADLSDAAALGENGWHLAFRRTDLRVNGGHLSAAGIRVARITDTRFEDVHVVPTEIDWADDSGTWEITEGEDGELACSPVLNRGKPNGAFNALNQDRPLSASWYHYDMATHRPTPFANTVYLVQDGEGVTWKLELSSYATVEGNGVWNVRWAKLQGAVCDAAAAGVNVDAVLARRADVYDYEGAGQLSTSTEVGGVWTATIQAGGGHSAENDDVFAPVHAMTYLDLDSGAIDSRSDYDAAEDTDWEIAFRRAAIRFNGGDVGPGNIRVARLTRAEVSASSETSTVYDDTTFDHVAGNLSWTSDAIAFDWEARLDDEENEVAVCSYLRDWIQQPWLSTAYLNQDNEMSGDWYTYGGGSQGPLPDTIYLLHDTERDLYWKLELTHYWAASAAEDATRQVEYDIRWEQLTAAE